jgi:hypothetical protein
MMKIEIEKACGIAPRLTEEWYESLLKKNAFHDRPYQVVFGGTRWGGRSPASHS